MIRLVLLLSAVVAVVVGRRSPNADVVETLFKASVGSRFSTNIAEDALLDVPGLISKYGYPVETHHVTTSDGYILETHRIPYGHDRNNQPGQKKPVVFLMHGLLSSSADFIVLGPGNALAYLLAEEGYDVWIGNARGNYYSRHHVSLNPDSRLNSNFWRFSWEQIGLYDLPAFVDYILDLTEQSKLHYVGHSQGGTTFLVLNSLRPEYNDKFISFQGLAPASYFTNNDHSIYTSLAPNEKVLETAAFAIGMAEILTNTQFHNLFGSDDACDLDDLFQPICASIASDNTNFVQMNQTMLPLFLAHAPAGASIRQISHYAQTIRRDSFARFYFDALTNLRTYGRINPPEFDMGLVTVPAYIYYGLSDSEVDYRDVYLLAQRIGNLAGLFKADRASLNHFDFIWGANIKVEVYDKLIESLKVAEGNYS